MVSRAKVEARFTGPMAIMDISVITGVHMGANGINATPRTYRYSSAFIRPIATEVRQDKWWRQGNGGDI